VILIGIDDTDTLDTPGTNQLARRLADSLPAGFQASLILRHQLLFDPRVPYTSQNGSASLAIRHEAGRHAVELLPMLQAEFRAWYVPGSDPGLCVAERVSAEVVEFGRRCQREVVGQEDARVLAAAEKIHLEGFGGTEGGVIGALAAVGLLAGGDDGRVVHLPGWTWPDDFTGWQSAASVRGRGVQEILAHETGQPVADGLIDVGKHLRPSYRKGRVVLVVQPANGEEDAGRRWRAVKLP
jgi:hypothetical protein